MTSKSVKVAAIQAEPVWNDLQGGVDKTISLIKEANVIGFPEVFIPGYPWSIWANSPVESAPWVNEYFNNSLERESVEMDRIREAVRDAGMFVVLGYSERYRGTVRGSPAMTTARGGLKEITLIVQNKRERSRYRLRQKPEPFTGTLYISQSFIDETGTIIHHRRKIKPTHVERAIYGDGQGESLQSVVPPSFGRIAGLNCWEHTQPLLRHYEYSQGVDIHVSSWPTVVPKHIPEWPGHISAENCIAFLHILSMEGACFVVVATQVMSSENHEKANVVGFDYTAKSGGGFSMIYSPFSEPLVKALAPDEEGILYADVDLAQKYKAKQNLDVVGHYARPDQLSLRVNKHAAKPVIFANEL